MPVPRRRALLALAAAAVLALAACGDDEPAESSSAGVPVACDDTRVPEPMERPRFEEPPALEIDPDVTYTATLDTSCGEIVMELDAGAAPVAVNNFVFLARQGYYDGLTFHRTVPGFVIQGGDPFGNGTGGPGYQFADELPDDGYPKGTVAMANSGPDTNGSQFFIVSGNADQLPNAYSKFGEVTAGLDIAETIESLGDPTTQAPEKPVYIYSVTIREF